MDAGDAVLGTGRNVGDFHFALDVPDAHQANVARRQQLRVRFIARLQTRYDSVIVKSNYTAQVL